MFSGGVRLYRLWLRKGKPFLLQMKGNPPVEHDGGNTVVHLALTEAQSKALALVVDQYGAEFDLIPHEQQTPEQSEERQALLGMNRGDRVWPSLACPKCPWFDPLLKEEPCGKAGWAPEAVSALEEGEACRKALSDCPTPHVWGKVG